MTTEDLPGGSAPRTAYPEGVVAKPPPVREDELTKLRDPDFPVALRGYDRDAVDAYVERATRVIAELAASSSPQAAIKHALDQVGSETRGILERAHETADEITARSRAQAEDRLTRAEEEAREAVATAETRVRVLDADADEVWRERKRLVADVARVAADLRELADAARRRFPADEPAGADTAAIETVPDMPDPDEPIAGAGDERGADVPPPPPPPVDTPARGPDVS